MYQNMGIDVRLLLNLVPGSMGPSQMCYASYNGVVIWFIFQTKRIYEYYLLVFLAPFAFALKKNPGSIAGKLN